MNDNDTLRALEKEWQEYVDKHDGGYSHVEGVKKCLSELRAALAHPDFRAQLRAWAAEEMRGLVPKEETVLLHGGTEEERCDSYNACRAETLANIEKWESSRE